MVFFIFIYFLTEHSVSKQWIPCGVWSGSTVFDYVPHRPIYDLNQDIGTNGWLIIWDMVLLPVHVGVASVHRPYLSQLISLLPLRAYPFSQEIVSVVSTLTNHVRIFAGDVCTDNAPWRSCFIETIPWFIVGTLQFRAWSVRDINGDFIPSDMRG